MVYQKIEDYSVLKLNGDAFAFLEKRIENDGSGNPLYVGYAKKPNESTAATTWFITKISYSGGYPVRVQIPDDGPKFGYAWDSKAAAFS